MVKQEYKLDISFTQNRELSWLKFNERVFEEAVDSFVPLYERLKFVSIFSNNLDEFFMIRVGSLYDLSLLTQIHIDNKSGMNAQQQLSKIYDAVLPLYKNKDKTFWRLEEQLRQFDIYKLNAKELQNNEKKFLQSYFETYVLPVLSPQIVDTHHPFPHLENKSLNIAVTLKTKSDNKFGIIPIPKMLSRIIFLPGESIRYILIEDLILEYTQAIFDMYTVIEKAVICVTRNADINPDDEAFEFEEDFRFHMKKILKKRARLAPVRLEVQNKPDTSLINYLCDRLNLKKEQVFYSTSPLDMSYVYSLEEKFPISLKRSLTYASFEPQLPSDINEKESIIKQVLRKDILLYYPYESMEPFLRMVKEASVDASVISIKITLYRIDKKSKLAEYLINAAESGKDITVIMELRARFDEQNNIEWAERLEESGCKVIYGFDGFKVHSKICLITRHDKTKLQYITQIGTGNYNEKTSKLYSDLCLITSNEELGNDAVIFFKNMSISNLDGHYNHLLVAPSSLKRPILALIDGEIDKALEGRSCGIIFKLNSLTDRDIIDKLSQASQAGVPINLIIRGICCIVPGKKNKTENITVRSIIGRFLEHPRIFCFGHEEDMKIYISSADMMTRNTERRVEIACPILDTEIKNRILNIIKIQLLDNVKARQLTFDGSYARIASDKNMLINSQEYFMQEAIKTSQIKAVKNKGFSNSIKSVFHRLRKEFYLTD